VIGAFVGPVLMVWLFVALLGTVEKRLKEPPKPDVVVIPGPDRLLEALVGPLSNRLLTAPDEASAGELIEDGKAKLAVRMEPQTRTLVATYDSDDPMSQVAMGALRQAVDAVNKKSTEAVLERLGADKAAAEPIKFEARALADKGLGGSSLLGMLPYLIVLWAFYGGMSLASDLVAGEKERGTLETLLVSPTDRWQIVIGKFLALALTCLLSALTSFAGLLLLPVMDPKAAQTLAAQAGAGLGAVLPPVVALLVPLVALFAAVLIAVSTRARNMRESQTYLTLLSLVVLLPAVFSQFIGFTGLERAAWVKWTPVLGHAVGLREALMGRPDWGTVGASAVVGLGIAALALAWTRKAFLSESILAKG
jgi:sodium transport system permease protein